MFRRVSYVGSDALCSNSNEYSRSSKIILDSEQDWPMLWRERRKKREKEKKGGRRKG